MLYKCYTLDTFLFSPGLFFFLKRMSFDVASLFFINGSFLYRPKKHKRKKRPLLKCNFLLNLAICFERHKLSVLDMNTKVKKIC